MCLQTRLRELIDAGFSGLWVQSNEPDEAISEIRQLANREQYAIHGQDPDTGNLTTEPGPEFSPYQALQELAAIPADSNAAPLLLILPAFHSFMGDPPARQLLFRAIQNGKKRRQYVLIIAPPAATIPPELEKVLVCVEHELPTRADLLKIAQEIAAEGELPTGPEQERLLDAAAGLTRYEAEGAFALSIVRHGRLDPESVFALKAQSIKNSGLAEIWKGSETVDGLGGLSEVKKRLAMARDVTGPWKPKGIILVGQPGTGKSFIAKAAGRILGRPVVSASLSRLKGQYVGETGKNTRRLLALIRAIGPCVVVLDEGNQQMGGGSERHETTEEMIGELLTFLNDQQEAYFILTANEIKSIPDALTRPGRFDAVFFVDLPSAEQRAEIWTIHLKKYGLAADSTLPDSEGWTGAEIEEACKGAAMYGPQGISLADSAAWVMPIATRQAEQIEERRKWAAGRCFDADRPGPFTRTRAPETRRAIVRKTDLD
jgi:hypothetical protein